MERGQALLERDPAAWQREVDQGKAEDLATIIYTSGTTGEPKGVMLTHANFLHNLRTIPKAIEVGPADMFLSVLPVWHSFERIIENFALSRGATLAYSKPIGKIMLADMAAVQADHHGLRAPHLGRGARGHLPQRQRGGRDQEGAVQLLRRRSGKAHATATALVQRPVPAVHPPLPGRPTS